MDTLKEARDAFIQSLGIEYSAKFVPQSVSRHKSEKTPSLNWTISLKKGGTTIETDYMQGIGHVPDMPQSFHTCGNGRLSLFGESQRKPWYDAAETGRYPVGNGYQTRALPEPKLEDVLYSLVMDSSAFSMTFEEWCGEYGYDTDSRKAHATYLVCSDNGLRLQRMVGGPEGLQKLQELFQDY